MPDTEKPWNRIDCQPQGLKPFEFRASVFPKNAYLIELTQTVFRLQLACANGARIIIISEWIGMSLSTKSSPHRRNPRKGSKLERKLHSDVFQRRQRLNNSKIHFSYPPRYKPRSDIFVLPTLIQYCITWRLHYTPIEIFQVFTHHFGLTCDKKCVELANIETWWRLAGPMSTISSKQSSLAHTTFS